VVGIVQAQVQIVFIMPGHGEARAGADADQQRVLGIAQFLADLLFEFLERGEDLLVDLGGNTILVLEINVADFRWKW
jgi:hypothetical protein